MTPSRIFLIAAALIIMAVFEAQAQNHGHHGGFGRDPLCPPDPTYNCPPNFVRPGEDHRPPAYNPPPYQPPTSGMQRQDIFVGRYMQNERMDLNYYLDRRIVIERVDVLLRNQMNMRANISLLANNRVEDSRSALSNLVTLIPRRPISLDEYQGSFVQLEVMGQAYVDRVVVYFRTSNMNPPPSNPGGYDLSARVNRLFQGFNTLEIGQLVNLYQYRGYRVQSVTILGSSMQGRGQVSVRANGFAQGAEQILPIYNANLTFFVFNPSQIGIDLNSLTLQMQGNITIDQVVVRVIR